MAFRTAFPVALAGALLALLPTRASAVDNDPPKIDHAAVEDAPARVGLAIAAAITDESEIFEPTLYYRPAGTRKFLSASMHAVGTTRYSATIPEEVMTGDVEYFIEAYDSNGNGPAQFASADKPQRVRVGASTSAAAESSTGRAPPTRAAARRPHAEAPEQAVVRPRGDEGGLLRTVGFTAAGVGVAGLGLGTYFYLTARSLNDQAIKSPSATTAQQKQADARSNATRATASWIAGSVVGAAGLALVLFAPTSPTAPSAARSGPEARLIVSPGGATFAMTF